MEVLLTSTTPSLISNLEVRLLIHNKSHLSTFDSKVAAYLASTSNTKESGLFKEYGPTGYEKKIEGLVGVLKGGRDGILVKDEVVKIEQDVQPSPSSSEKGASLKKGYGLEDSEIIQILNHMPSTLVALHLFIQDCENRFTEEEQLGILAEIQIYI